MTQTNELAQRVASLRKPLLIALDVDGTLAPIVDDPSAAVIPETTLDNLEHLAALSDVRVALISGRDFASLAKLAPSPNVWRAVEHGAAIFPPGDTEETHDWSRERTAAFAEFEVWASGIADAAYVEVKPRSVAIHVRQLQKTDPDRATSILEGAEAKAKELGLHRRRGRAVLEAAIVDSDKASALAEIATRTGAHSVFYAGDDLTDFPAIAYATDLGLGVFVQSSERRNPAKVSATLSSLESLSECLGQVVKHLT